MQSPDTTNRTNRYALSLLAWSACGRPVNAADIKAALQCQPTRFDGPRDAAGICSAALASMRRDA
jgi:hypothetical protein